MLVLERKLFEKILINNNIEIMITSLTNDSVRLGITAPKDVVISRAELGEFKEKRSKKNGVKNN